MRALPLLCVCLVLVCAACAPPLPDPPAAPRIATPGPASQPLTRAAARTPRPRPTLAPVPVPTPAPTNAPARFAVPAPVLDGLLDGLVPDSGADYSLVLEDLASGVRAAVNADQPLPSASLYKLGVAWAVMRQVDAGTLGLDGSVDIEDDDAVEPEPDGGVGVGDTPTLHEALVAMLSLSSNAAAHALLRTIGRDAFAEEMDRIGLHQTRVPDDGMAVTSAVDMAHLLRLIATSGELSDASRTLIAEAMANIAPPDALRDTLPDGVGIFEKTGNLEDASNVGALLETPRGTAILVVIDSGADPGDARAIIAQAGQIAYRALLQ
jgi:beta-lactamase class A